MSKLTYKDKINIYNKRKKGIGVVELSKIYKVNRSYIYYLENIIETTSERIKYVDERKNNFET